MSRLLCFAVLLTGVLVVTATWSALAGKADAGKGEGAQPVAGTGESGKPAVARRSAVLALLQTIDYRGNDDPKATLQEELAALEKLTGVPFQVNERAFKYEMLNKVLETPIAEGDPLPAMKAPLVEVLRKVLGRVPVPSGATWMVRRGRIEITTGQFKQAEVATEREQAPRGPMPKPAASLVPGVPGALPAPVVGVLGDLRGLGRLGGPASEVEVKKIGVAIVSVDLEKQPFEEAVRQIQMQANINLVLDPSLRDKASAPLTVTLLNAPMDSAALVLTEMADLDFVWLDNIFFVTSKEKAEKLRSKWPPRRSGGASDLIITEAAGAGGM
jgi:hypothetical protein